MLKMKSSTNLKDAFAQLQADFCEKYEKIGNELRAFTSTNSNPSSGSVQRKTFEDLMEMLETIKCLLSLEEFRDKFTMLETLNDIQIKYENSVAKLEEGARIIEDKNQELMVLKEYIADNWGTITGIDATGENKSKVVGNGRLPTRRLHNDVELIRQVMQKNEKLEKENESITYFTKELEERIISLDDLTEKMKNEKKAYQKELNQLSMKNGQLEKRITTQNEEKASMGVKFKEMKSYTEGIENENIKMGQTLRDIRRRKTTLEDEFKQLNFSVGQMMTESMNISEKNNKSFEGTLETMHNKYKNEINRLQAIIDESQNEQEQSESKGLVGVVSANEESISLYENKTLLREGIRLQSGNVAPSVQLLDIEEELESDDVESLDNSTYRHNGGDEGMLFFTNPFGSGGAGSQNSYMETPELPNDGAETNPAPIFSPRRTKLHLRTQTEPEPSAHKGKHNIHFGFGYDEGIYGGDRSREAKHEKRISSLNPYADGPALLEVHEDDEEEEYDEEDQENYDSLLWKARQSNSYGGGTLKKSLTPIPELNRSVNCESLELLESQIPDNTEEFDEDQSNSEEEEVECLFNILFNF